MLKNVDFMLVLGGQLDKADMQKSRSIKITPCAFPRQKRLETQDWGHQTQPPKKKD